MKRIAPAFAAFLLAATAAAQSPSEVAMVPSSLGPLRVTTIASGLVNPWAWPSCPTDGP